MTKYRVPTLHSFSWQEPVLDKDLLAAPLDPNKGDRYIIPNEGIVSQDVWEGYENCIVWYDGEAWNFDIPENGWHVYVQDEMTDYIFDGLIWGSAQTSVEIFVDSNRVDMYSPTGSSSLPYKTIMTAINHVITNNDNSLYKGYVIDIAPGKYEETVTLDSTSLVNLFINGKDSASVFVGIPGEEKSLTCTTNNDSFESINIQGISFINDVDIIGESNGTNIGTESFKLIDCLYADLTLRNVNNPIIHNSGTFNSGTVTWSNINNGLVSGNLTFSNFIIESDATANKPSGWISDTFGCVLQNIGQRIDNLSFNLMNDSRAYVSVRSGGHIASTTSIIPETSSIIMYNSTLVGNWNLYGSLELNAGSHITGDLIEHDGSTLTLTGQKSSQVAIGAVPDGDQMTDGIIALPPENKVSWALDEFNEIIKDMAPAEPNKLSDIDLYCTASTCNGKLSNGLVDSWYPLEIIPGNTVRVIHTDTFVLSSGVGADNSYQEPVIVPWVPLTTNSARFRQGNIGTLKVKHDEGGVGLNVVATLDIEANFIKSPAGITPRYPTEQDLSQWDIQGDGDPCENGIVDLINSKGTLQVTSVKTFNNFPLWQKMNAKINVTAIDEGYNSFTLLHDGLFPEGEETNEYQFFYDDSEGVLNFSENPTVIENTLLSTKYLSGVRYYTTGDSFDIRYVGVNVFQKVYHTSAVSTFVCDGLSGTKTRNPSGVPNVDETFVVDETIVVDGSNIYDLDSRLTANLQHPWKTTATATSASEQRLIHTYGNVATDVADSFLDERYRLPDGDYDTIPSQVTGQWDSSAPLVNGQALIYNRRIQYPTLNLTTTLPANNPDYSAGFSGNQTYLRAFRDISSPHSSIILNIGGITSGEISKVGSGSLNLEIKLPTQTGWLDCGVAFNSALFTGVDGDGCLSNISGTNWTFTFGTFSTANSGNLIIARFTFRNASQYLNSNITANW